MAKYDNNQLNCYDVFANGMTQMDNILSIMANEDTDTVCLGFTPISKEGYIVEKSKEEDTRLFVQRGKENIFKENRVIFPLLSRA